MDHGQRRQGGPRHLMARLSELGVDFQHWCFACGQLNNGGMHLDFDVSRDRAEARYTALQRQDRKSTRLNSSHVAISYAVFCLKKKNVPACDDGIDAVQGADRSD